jgi:hypothetical protein
MYCTYLTIYDGKKLPPFYIGSCKTSKIKEGYNGSVGSKKFKKIYDEEQKYNKYLFDTIILEEFETQKESISYELYLHQFHEVVKNSEFFNESEAKPNGFFGMDNSGKNNSMFGIPSPGIGSKWMFKKETGECLKIQKENIENFLNDGWEYGRPSVRAENNPNSGRIYRYMNNGTLSKQVSPEQFEKYLENGWKLGAIKKKSKETISGKIKIINLTTDKRIYIKEEDLEKFKLEGFVKYLKCMDKSINNAFVFNGKDYVSLVHASKVLNISTYRLAKMKEKENGIY